MRHLAFSDIVIPKLENYKGKNVDAAPRVVELIPDQEKRRAESRGFAREMALKVYESLYNLNICIDIIKVAMVRARC